VVLRDFIDRRLAGGAGGVTIAADLSFLSMGLDIPTVALLTGHKTWAMLRRYTDIKPEDVHAAVEKRRA